MRVIAGSARRTELKVAPGTIARPFLERARGALFNVLSPVLSEANVLDLFAGSGALGIEALSRGAADAVFVERDRRSAQMVEENLERCGLGEKGSVLCRTVEVALGQLAGPFDLVFMDPPFPMVKGWGASGPGGQLAAGLPLLLEEGGHLVFRHEPEKGQPLPPWPGLACIWDRCYGRSQVCIYTHA